MQIRFRLIKEFPPVLKRSRGITTSWDKKDISRMVKENGIKDCPDSNME